MTASAPMRTISISSTTFYVRRFICGVVFSNRLMSAPSTPVALELPNQWLWDIVDEFIYQFQAFCQYRSNLKTKSEEEISQLRAAPDAWQVTEVLRVLHALMEKSQIRSQLKALKLGQDLRYEGDIFYFHWPRGLNPLSRLETWLVHLEIARCTACSVTLRLSVYFA